MAIKDKMTIPSKIAFVDIETAPSLGWVWSKWETNVIDFKKDWYLLSFAVKWVGEKKVKTYGLIDYPGYKKDVENDEQLVKVMLRNKNGDFVNGNIVCIPARKIKWD